MPPLSGDDCYDILRTPALMRNIQGPCLYAESMLKYREYAVCINFF